MRAPGVQCAIGILSGTAADGSPDSATLNGGYVTSSFPRSSPHGFTIPVEKLGPKLYNTPYTMSQTVIGAAKINANRLGMTLQAFLRRSKKSKWCTYHKAWHPRPAFHADGSRRDGLANTCKQAHSQQARDRFRRTYKRVGRMGPIPDPARNGDKLQARARINHQVQKGLRPSPNTLPCFDCGHVWKRRQPRHEYDHYLGYESQHHNDVQPTCSKCHARRTRERGELLQSRDARGKFKGKK